MINTKAIVKHTGEVVTLRKRTIKTEARGQMYEILEDNHRVFFEDDLFIIEDLWEFFEQYLTDYTRDERVALHDDIECCLCSEADDDKLNRVKCECGNSPEDWLREQCRIEQELIAEAVYNFRYNSTSQK